MNLRVNNHLTDGQSGAAFVRSAESVVEAISRDCTRCGRCLEKCSFLQRHAVPGRIAKQQLVDASALFTEAFSCSLCRLCTRICPQGLPIAEMFLELRRMAVSKGQGRFKGHRSLLVFEAIGNSALMTSYLLPAGCKTVFFPGCSLPGIRSRQTYRVFSLLQKRIPNLGLVLDCCNKPSHDLGFHDRFLRTFRSKLKKLQARGVTKVVTACPSCYQIFRQYGEGIETTTIYSHLDEQWGAAGRAPDGHYTLHDPCTVRFEPQIHLAVRDLLRSLGVQFTEMEHNRSTTICCGEGGAAGHIPGGRDSGWKEKRLAEVGDAELLTYCAGCTQHLASNRTHYLLDLLFSDRQGREKTIKAPFTYLHRLYLKLRMITIFSVREKHMKK